MTNLNATKITTIAQLRNSSIIIDATASTKDADVCLSEWASACIDEHEETGIVSEKEVVDFVAEMTATMKGGDDVIKCIQHIVPDMTKQSP